jgi:hypothetical protein
LRIILSADNGPRGPGAAGASVEAWGEFDVSIG